MVDEFGVSKTYYSDLIPKSQKKHILCRQLKGGGMEIIMTLIIAFVACLTGESLDTKDNKIV
ncbi:MAG: hypothetical protein K2I10_03250 [Lachnospiraceae bacterium]|nr:hypothetical protein [Lachnospiraceae bacterium]